MALTWEIIWLVFIGLCILATLFFAYRDNSRRKAAQQARANAMHQSQQSINEPDAMDNLDGFGSASAEPDFDFPKS